MHIQEVANAVACPMFIIEPNIPQGFWGKASTIRPGRGDLQSVGWIPAFTNTGFASDFFE